MDKKTRDFINKVKGKDNPKHKDLDGNWLYSYDRTEYKTLLKSITIGCKVHGYFKQKATNHLYGAGCHKCGVDRARAYNITDKDIVISKAISVHGELYLYDKVDYVNTLLKVEIGCKIHGYFKQSLNIHIRGSGCPKCAFLLLGYTKTAFKENCIRNNKGLGILYIIRCFNESESFYKIGITSKSVKKRYTTDMPYNYEVIHEVHREPNKVYDMENHLLKELATYRYEPLLPFDGKTECISSLEPFYKLFRDKLAA